jgi:hypothetical protein
MQRKGWRKAKTSREKKDGESVMRIKEIEFAVKVYAKPGRGPLDMATAAFEDGDECDLATLMVGDIDHPTGERVPQQAVVAPQEEAPPPEGFTGVTANIDIKVAFRYQSGRKDLVILYTKEVDGTRWGQRSNIEIHGTQFDLSRKEAFTVMNAVAKALHQGNVPNDRRPTDHIKELKDDLASKTATARENGDTGPDAAAAVTAEAVATAEVAAAEAVAAARGRVAAAAAPAAGSDAGEDEESSEEEEEEEE